MAVDGLAVFLKAHRELGLGIGGAVGGIDLNRYFPDKLRVRGYRTSIPLPRELHSFGSHLIAHSRRQFVIQRAPTPFLELLGYCMLGAQGFTESNDPSLTQAVEARLAAALEAGVSLDARIVLLTLHAGVIQPSVVERYALKAG